MMTKLRKVNRVTRIKNVRHKKLHVQFWAQNPKKIAHLKDVLLCVRIMLALIFIIVCGVHLSD
jgi:hypothetical protein